MWQRIFWSLLVGAIAMALLAAGGLTALQAGTIAAALPFTVIMILACIGMLRAMRLDVAKREAVRGARGMPPGPGAHVDWRARLRMLVQQPGCAEVREFVQATVLPALGEVAGELREQGIPAEAKGRDDGSAWLRVGHGEEMDFLYSVRLRPYEPPSFVLGDARDPGGSVCRAEVHLREGGQGYDIMGWSRGDVIHDVLDQYRRHMHFLDAVR